MLCATACLAPFEHTISSGAYVSPFSRWSFSAMASRSSGIPALAVYIVKPSSTALMAASRMGSGVTKSGSPAESEITGRPSRMRAWARPDIAIVALGRMAATSGLRAREASESVVESDMEGKEQRGRGHRKVPTPPRRQGRAPAKTRPPVRRWAACRTDCAGRCSSRGRSRTGRRRCPGRRRSSRLTKATTSVPRTCQRRSPRTNRL